MKIAILGRQNFTINYENYVKKISALPVPTLSPGELCSCDGLILPGGGDITPAFFGERNMGSRNIDTELDILQFQALDFCVRRCIPVLGICKGMQVINVAFGGTITQDLPTACRHRYIEADQYHQTIIAKGSCLYTLYGQEMWVNSAHHQGVKRLGAELQAIQWCPEDGCIEAIVHNQLPILGVQWHPERLQPQISSPPNRAFTQEAIDNQTFAHDGYPLLELFASWISKAPASLSPSPDI